jgi:transposase
MDNDQDEFVSVGGFMQPTEAQMAMGMLEAAGIECVLQGENANNMLAFAFRARLKVRRADEEAARELLEAARDGAETPGSFDA